MKKSPLADLVSVTLRNKNEQELLTSALGFLALANLLGVTGYLNAQTSKNKKSKKEKHEISEELLSKLEVNKDNQEKTRKQSKTAQDEQKTSEIDENNTSSEYTEKSQGKAMLMEEKIISEEEKNPKTAQKNTPKHDFRKKHCVEKFKPLVWRFPPK